MVERDSRFDAVIVGGGFYGALIAVYLVRQRGLERVLIVEAESGLCQRASRNNQARVHNGYHYPRSFTTAFRSRVNLPRFVRDWSSAVTREFTALYAIARRNSKVSALQFERFCREIGAPLRRADPSSRSLFDARLIEEVFVVEEYAFDATVLGQLASDLLAESGVEVRCQTRAVRIEHGGEDGLQVELCGGQGEVGRVVAPYVFNCTYSGLNQMGGDFPGVHAALKHEVTEMALIRLPPALRDMAVTVMDGPFFSIMPYPPRSLHTLSHVRYTPHLHWEEVAGIDPYQKLADYPRVSRVDRMLRDAQRYLPAIGAAEVVESIFEVKTVLVKSEGDDGRPILFERHAELPGCYSVLGGKIDNIFDVLDKLDSEQIACSKLQAGEKSL
ncbi:NAD(P)/FAD-dependent oxidoreductase [Dokdonella immobilis]|uniref:FAD dependent oxidoreductase n=1 Tax=Dokdonella immobilis TaxID=578942 RepID=A0A1I4ZC64_9GAMM|nr:FAD-dependent oxidoreductase [Dokdonella immobilis]SFN47864.1 FAD dependent oxidoreductase [Dokdonella immobilis]